MEKLASLCLVYLVNLVDETVASLCPSATNADCLCFGDTWWGRAGRNGLPDLNLSVGLLLNFCFCSTVHNEHHVPAWGLFTCTWYQSTLGQRSIVWLILLLYNLIWGHIGWGEGLSCQLISIWWWVVSDGGDSQCVLGASRGGNPWALWWAVMIRETV